MPFDHSGGTDPKYRSKAHRDERAKWARLMGRQHYLECQQPECLEPSRIIEEGQTWHLGHDDNGIDYIGPTHPRCNVVDGAKRGRARQESTDLKWLEVEPTHPWLRRDNHPCPVCGATVIWASQRCCSRECSNTLRHKPKPERASIPCSICGTPFTPWRGATYCSDPCRVEKNRRVQRDRYRERAGLPVDPEQPTSKWLSVA